MELPSPKAGGAFSLKAVIPDKRVARRSGTAGSAELSAVPALRCAAAGMTGILTYRAAVVLTAGGLAGCCPAGAGATGGRSMAW